MCQKVSYEEEAISSNYNDYIQESITIVENFKVCMIILCNRLDFHHHIFNVVLVNWCLVLGLGFMVLGVWYSIYSA